MEDIRFSATCKQPTKLHGVITREAVRPLSSESCPLLVRRQHYTSFAFKPFFGLVMGKQSASRCSAVYESAGRISYFGVCTESCPKTIFLSFGQMDRFGVETLIPLSGCIAAALLPHTVIIVRPRYRRLELQGEQNEFSFFPLLPGFRKSILC